MSAVKFHKVVGSLPGSLEANSVYFLRTGAGFSIHITNDLGQVEAYNLNHPELVDDEATPTGCFFEFMFTGDNPETIDIWDSPTKMTLYKKVSFTWLNDLPSKITITNYISLIEVVFDFIWLNGIISSINKVVGNIAPNRVIGIETTRLSRVNKVSGDNFGATVAISSNINTFVIGARTATVGSIQSGAAYVYKWNGSTYDITELLASDRLGSDNFSSSVAISPSGDTIVVGADSSDPSGVLNAGAVYVYKWNGSVWVETKITASDKLASDGFGKSVAISYDCNTIVVGASAADPGSVINAGAVYVYKWNGSIWAETKIVASDKTASDAFGMSLDINSDGTIIVVGALLADPDTLSSAGAVYVYKWNGSIWAETKITASDKKAGAMLGKAVSVNSDGSIFIASAYQDNQDGVTGAGAVYVYKWNGSIWAETKIVASDKTASDAFGMSLDINSDGNAFIVGASLADPGSISNSGSAYIYKYVDSIWSETKLTASINDVNGFFGSSVAISLDGNNAIVGAPNLKVDSTTNAGMAFIYN